MLSKYQNKIDIKIDGIGKFENKDFSVVKLNLISPVLHEINKDLRQLPHTSDFDTYSPHMTISFVNNGSVDKYVDNSYQFNISVDPNFIFSSVDGRFRIE